MMRSLLDSQLLNDRLPRHPLFRILAVVSLVLILLYWSYSGFNRSRTANLESREDLQNVQKWSREILAASNRPRVASLDIEPPGQIANRVEKALARAQIEPTRLRSVDPQPPTRIVRSDYQIRATQIMVENVTMKQLVFFMEHLRDRNSGLVVRDLNLTPKKASGASQELWDARLTLTQMIFFPISES